MATPSTATTRLALPCAALAATGLSLLLGWNSFPSPSPPPHPAASGQHALRNPREVEACRALGLPTPEEASRNTRVVVLKRLFSHAEVDHLVATAQGLRRAHRVGDVARDRHGESVLAATDMVWRTSYLHTNGEFARRLPEVKGRLTAALRQVDDEHFRVMARRREARAVGGVGTAKAGTAGTVGTTAGSARTAGKAAKERKAERVGVGGAIDGHEPGRQTVRDAAVGPAAGGPAAEPVSNGGQQNQHNGDSGGNEDGNSSGNAASSSCCDATPSSTPSPSTSANSATCSATTTSSSSPSSDFHLRTVEFHEYWPGGQLKSDLHYDAGSCITVDVCLASPGDDFQGGQLATPDLGGGGDGSSGGDSDGSSDGSGNDSSQSRPLVAVEGFEKGDAAFFVSHKYHNVLPVTAGKRMVLVAEIWEGPEKSCPHRCLTAGPCTHSLGRAQMSGSRQHLAILG